MILEKPKSNDLSGTITPINKTGGKRENFLLLFLVIFIFGTPLALGLGFDAVIRHFKKPIEPYVLNTQTVIVKDEIMYLMGVTAPDENQCGGKEAKLELERLFGLGKVSYAVRGVSNDGYSEVYFEVELEELKSTPNARQQF